MTACWTRTLKLPSPSLSRGLFQLCRRDKPSLAGEMGEADADGEGECEVDDERMTDEVDIAEGRGE